MNIVRFSRRKMCGLLAGIFAAGAAVSVSRAALVDPTFDVLQTRTAAYTNVTVTTRAESYIMIFHSTGMNSIKIADLPIEVRQKLGYAVSGAARTQQPNDMTKVAARQLNVVSQSLKPFEDSLKQQWLSRRSALKINSEVIGTLLAILLLLHFSFSYCCHLICMKARGARSFLVWLPLLQWIPMFRAAGMSRWWCLAFFVPVLNIVAWVLWSWNIVNARGKHAVWAILLILPVTNLPAFLYLAFSSSAPEAPCPSAPATKFRTTGLQTA